MSGKEPPKGPRALRVSAPSTSMQNQSHNYQPQSQPTASSSRQPAALGAQPPKGPRSLAGGSRHTPPAHTTPPPPALSKPYLNGHSHGHGSSHAGAFGRTPPSGPKADRAPPSGPSALLGGSQRHLNGAPAPASARAPISFSLPAPPPPKQPPPPPPPGPPPHSGRPPSPNSHAPPPPPPPLQVSHFRSPISIKLPSAQPHEPRLAPPPLPPAPVEPPEPPAPQPPAFEPPPLPPADPRRLSSVPPPPPQYASTASPQALESPIADSKSPLPSRSPTPDNENFPDNVTVTWTHPSGVGRQRPLYSLKVPPIPERSSYTTPADRDFRLLFDEQCDKDRYSEMKALMQTLRTAGEDERLKDKGKGKMPLVYRFSGETVKGEREARPSDPRKAPGFKPPKPRAEFHSITYERDSNTPGSPPPTTVLVYGFPELMRNGDILRHFRKYGSVTSSDRELYRETGGQMGVIVLSFGSHEDARRAVEGEVGKNFATAGIGGGPTVSFANAKATGLEKDAVKVMLDGDGKLLMLVKSLYENMKKRERLQAQVSEAGGNASGSSVPPAASAQVQMAAPMTNGHIPQGPAMQQQYPQGPMAMARRPYNAPHPNQHPQIQVPPQGPHSQQSHHSLPLKPATHVTPRLPPRVGASQLSRGTGYPNHNEFGVQGPNPNARRFPPSSVNRARTINAVRSTVPHNLPSNLQVHGQYTPDTDNSRPVTPLSAIRGHRGARGLAHDLSHSHSHPHTPAYTSTSTPRGSRSPSPTAAGREKQTVVERDAKHRAVMEALVQNGHDHARIDESQLSSGAAREEDVKDFFKDFPVDKVLHDHTGWYITFEKPDAAGRVARVLAIGTHTLANRSVSVSVFPAPLPTDVKALSPASLAKGADARREWKPEELVEEAGKTVIAELRALLQKDVTERIVGAHIRKIVSETRERKGRGEDASQIQLDNGESARGTLPDRGEVERERRGLKGLTFKKRKQEVAGGIQHISEPTLNNALSAPDEPEVSLSVSKADDDTQLVAVVLPNNDEEQALVYTPGKEERPRKRQKKSASRIVRDDIESEDDEAETKAEAIPVHVEDIPPTEVASVPPIQLKRSISPELAAEPAPKRTKLEDEGVEERLEAVPTAIRVKSKKQPTKKLEKEKKTSKRGKKAKAEKAVLEALIIPPPQMEIEPPVVAEVRVSPSPAWASFPSPAPPVSAVSEMAVPPPKRYDPLPESVLYDLIGDDEDLYLSKLSLSMNVDNCDLRMLEENATSSAPSDVPPPFRKHITGSARSEGYYKISHAEKSAYVAQYALRNTSAEKEIVPQQHVVSSRSNRANARRKVQGLEEANQYNLAVALSKGENPAATDVMKFNQLQTRKKHLRFARSPIHDWGLYAMERIGRGEMVIEYVGEVIRAAVADKREKAYERQGIGSSYLFRIDEDLVVDATKKGNLGRLINHSCDPNCTAKIIMIHDEKKIVIYAKQDIELGDEITYDYHFPLEDDKIPCLCGAAKCRGFLN